MKFKLTILTILAILLVGCQESKISKIIFQQDKPASAKAPAGEQDNDGEETTTTPEEESDLPVDLSPEVSAEVEASAQVGEVLDIEAEGVELVVPYAAVPDFFDQAVAFVSQAPYAVWDDLHKEACEEAAMIMVVKHLKGEPLTAHTMEQGILNLVKYEEANGYKIDLTAEEAVKILQDHFELEAEAITEVTVERIKKELADGKLIIIPAAGRQLDNPYFQTPGPIYHMLVIRGYDQTNFITNDVGTKRGDGFKYEYQKLIDAIHDWDHQLAKDGMADEEIEQGRKVMIIVEK